MCDSLLRDFGVLEGFSILNAMKISFTFSRFILISTLLLPLPLFHSQADDAKPDEGKPDQGRIEKGIYYGPENPTAYQEEKCQLDLYLPTESSEKFPVVIFFHGGGITGGSRGGPDLSEKGIGLVAPSYRLSPKAQCPDYLNDAADAVAWTFKNIEKYGGDPERIFVSGSSAGSYLASMITMDKRWL